MMNILLIEDDPNTKSLFEMVADYHGYALKIVEDEQSVLDALQQQMPDVIVLDIFLPNTNGYKLMHKLRAIDGLSVCPLIATTAYYTSDTMLDVRHEGFDGCLLKPIDPITIAAYLTDCINNRRWSSHDLRS
jgi:DNA-binding response OmpR family regulator